MTQEDNEDTKTALSENDIKKTTFHNGIGRICRHLDIFLKMNSRRKIRG